MKKKPNFIYALIILLLGIFVAIFYFGNLNKIELLKNHNDTEIIYINNFFKTFESQDTKALSATLDSILQDPGFKKVFLKQNRDELNEYGQSLFQKLKSGYGITHFYFMLPDSTTFLRLHNPKIFGDLNNRITFKQAVDSQNIGLGFELGKTAFALRVVKPYYDNDKLIGYIELGQEIDHFLDVLKEETKNDYAIFVEKEKLLFTDWEAVRKNSNKENNWDDFYNMIPINSTVDLDDDINEYIKFCFNENNSQKFLSDNLNNNSIIDLDFKMACSGVLIKDAVGNNVGVLLFEHDLSDQIISYGNFINRINLLVIGLIIITLLGAFYIARKSLKAENKFKRLFESSLDAIMTINPPDWKFFDGNKATLEMFGLKDIKELQSITPSDLSPKYQPDGKLSTEKSKEMIDLALRDGFNSFEWNHKKLNGQEFIAYVSLNKIDKSNILQAIVRDITDEKKATDLIKQSEEKALKALEEAQHMNKLMVGREIEMIKLKKEILDLKNKLG